MTKEKTKTMCDTIWCLYSIADLDDQPDFNLEAWWKLKPSLETLFDLFGVSDRFDPDLAVAAVDLWRSTETTPAVRCGRKYFRLEQVKEGVRNDPT